ncbi:ParA family protein [Mesorhizobium sp.]|uniref:ParA family protein n=1 Tax=Mesorhizobium sp. TaxID=1871066 RepID=UPI000FE949DF|nr:ParA family protein [Mesorhizobium sp.]RWQ57826.1 MAG: ParA family protein [Mesorhizobium sp.]
MAKRLVVFNHKGGVSKTTSAYNIGWTMARTSRVLLVDADPQCNLTGLILGDDFEKYYTEDATKNQNIKDGVSATFDGKPIPITPVSCASPGRAPNLFLLAGHANLSEYDAALTFAQTSNNAITTLQNLPGAFAELLRLTEEKYGIDYTIIDLNPGLSAINQNLFLISNAFIIPTNPDPFSIMALETLTTVLPRWVSWKKSAVDLFANSAYPLPAGIPTFVGVLIQRFNIRKGRAAKPYRDNIGEIKTKVATTVYTAWTAAGMTLPPPEYEGIADEAFCLGEIPDFQGLLPKSYDAGVPVFELSDDEINETGPILEGFQQRRAYFRNQFDEISAKIVAILAHV